MADHNKSGSSAEEGAMEGGDEFDPFPGFYELCIEEHEGIDLNAPPENQ